MTATRRAAARHTHQHGLSNRPKNALKQSKMLQTSVRIINLTTLSIVFKRGSIGCIFVLKHNFLQLGHDSLSKQRRSLTPRSHHVSFTTETRTTCYRGGKHRSTQTCRLKTRARESRCERKKNRRVTLPQVIDLHWESGSNQRFPSLFQQRSNIVTVSFDSEREPESKRFVLWHVCNRLTRPLATGKESVD